MKRKQGPNRKAAVIGKATGKKKKKQKSNRKTGLKKVKLFVPNSNNYAKMDEKDPNNCNSQRGRKIIKKNITEQKQ